MRRCAPTAADRAAVQAFRMKITMRQATSTDHPWLFDLHKSAHRALVEQAYGPWDHEQQTGFFESLVNEHDIQILEANEKSVGAVYLSTRDHDTWLELIEVAPTTQNQGVGSAALRLVAHQSASQGRGTLLQVHRVNRDAKRLYEREGFIPFGETATHFLLRRP